MGTVSIEVNQASWSNG